MSLGLGIGHIVRKMSMDKFGRVRSNYTYLKIDDVNQAASKEMQT